MGMAAIELDHHAIRISQVGRRSPDGRRQVHAAVRGDLRGFDHCEIELPEKAEQDGLRHMRQVHVHVFDFLPIDLLPERGAALVRRSPGNGFGLSQLIIDALAARCSRQHTNPEWLSALMEGPGSRSKGSGNNLGRSRGAESAE